MTGITKRAPAEGQRTGRAGTHPVSRWLRAALLAPVLLGPACTEQQRAEIKTEAVLKESIRSDAKGVDIALAIQALSSEDASMRLLGVKALHHALYRKQDITSALPALTAAASDSNPEARKEATAALMTAAIHGYNIKQALPGLGRTMEQQWPAEWRDAWGAILFYHANISDREDLHRLFEKGDRKTRLAAVDIAKGAWYDLEPDKSDWAQASILILMEAFRNGDVHVRRAASEALSGRRWPKCDVGEHPWISGLLSELGKALEDSDGGIRMKTAYALFDLAEAGYPMSEVDTALTKAMGDVYPEVRQDVFKARALDRINRKDFTWIQAQIVGKDPGLSDAATDILASRVGKGYGIEDIRGIVSIGLDHPRETVRAHTVGMIKEASQRGEDIGFAVSGLRKIASGSGTEIRWDAAEALASDALRKGEKKSADGLLQSKDPWIVAGATAALNRSLLPSFEPLIPVLERNLAHPNSAVAGETAEVLVKWYLQRSDWTALEQLLRHPGYNVRRASMYDLLSAVRQKTSLDPVAAVIRGALEDTDPLVRTMAEEITKALARSGSGRMSLELMIDTSGNEPAYLYHEPIDL